MEVGWTLLSSVGGRRGLCWQAVCGCQHVAPSATPWSDQALDAIDSRGLRLPDVDGLVEWSADAEGAHCGRRFAMRTRDAFLH